jgi:hypothetical protein
VGFDLQWVKDDSARGYHRLTHAAMGALAKILDTAELLDWAEPAWERRRTQRDHQQLLRFRSRRPGRVPAIKFTTNDGWLVTAPECGILADGLEARGASAIEASAFDAEARASWHATQPELVRYFRRCARVGGFRVW